MDTLYQLLEWNPVQVGSTFQGGVCIEKSIPRGRGGGVCIEKSGQGPKGPRPGRVLAVGISPLRRREWSPPPAADLPPTYRRPTEATAFYSVFGLFHFSGFVAQDGSTWPNISRKKCPSWANMAPRWANIGSRWANIAPKLGQDNPKMGQHSPKMGQHSPKMGQHSLQAGPT